eukprot:NODE_317_length_11122_cov_0.359521.p7 type:complete len:100 gc:universal NODE_317_length_11122_cov_0.359521:3436-3137(-)
MAATVQVSKLFVKSATITMKNSFLAGFSTDFFNINSGFNVKFETNDIIRTVIRIVFNTLIFTTLLNRLLVLNSVNSSWLSVGSIRVIQSLKTTKKEYCC